MTREDELFPYNKKYVVISCFGDIQTMFKKLGNQASYSKMVIGSQDYDYDIGIKVYQEMVDSPYYNEDFLSGYAVFTARGYLEALAEAYYNVTKNLK